MSDLLPLESNNKHPAIRAAYRELREAAMRVFAQSELAPAETRLVLAIALRELAQQASADARIKVLNVLEQGPADLYALVEASGLDAALLYQVLGHWAEVKIKTSDGRRRYHARYPRRKRPQDAATDADE